MGLLSRRRVVYLLGLWLVIVLAITGVNYLQGEHHPVLALLSSSRGVKHHRGSWERDTTFVAVANLNSDTLIKIRDAFSLKRIEPLSDSPSDPNLHWETSLGFKPPPWWTPSNDLSETYYRNSRGESILLKGEDGKIYFRHFVH